MCIFVYTVPTKVCTFFRRALQFTFFITVEYNKANHPTVLQNAILFHYVCQQPVFLKIHFKPRHLMHDFQSASTMVEV